VLVSGRTEFRVRASGKNSMSAVALATVNFVLPPTAPFQTMVQSSASDKSDLNGRGTQNASGLNFSGDSLASPTHKMETYLPGVVYGQ